MIIAATYDNGEIFQHFGHTQQFKLYEIEGGKVISSRIVDNGGAGHEALTVYLRNLGVTKLMCGGVGGGAIMALSQMGIEVYPGLSGNPDEYVMDVVNGRIAPSMQSNCSHHGEHHSCHQ